jgi:hypothetical protein
MYKLIDFYRPVNKGDGYSFDRGMIYWTCVQQPFLSPAIKRWTEQRVRKIDVNQFNPSTENDDAENGTKAGEFWGINKYKKRPVIILSSQCPKYEDRVLKGGEFYLVAPLFTLRDKITKEYKFDKETVWGAISYNIKAAFYLPQSDKSELQESLILLERMFTIHCSWLQPPLSIRLSDDGLGCLNMWVRNFIYGSVPDWFQEKISTYRELIGTDPQTRTEVFGIGKYLQ